MNDTQNPQDIEQRVRHTLLTVAETVTEDAFATPGKPNTTRKSHPRRRIALGIGALAIPVTLAAAALVHDGPEYVDTIPPERIVMTGSVDGSSYLLIESDRIDQCGQPVTGVELVEESKNLLGSEWHTTGYEYGEYSETSCGYVNDPTRYLTNRALYSSSLRCRQAGSDS